MPTLGRIIEREHYTEADAREVVRQLRFAIVTTRVSCTAT